MNVSKEDCWKNTSWGYKWKRDYPLPFWSLKDWGKERGSKLSEFRLGIFHLKRLAVHWYVYNFSNYVRIINYRGFHAYECFCGYWHIYAISVLANRGQKRGIIVGKRTDWGALHWGKSGNNISFSHKGRERELHTVAAKKSKAAGREREGILLFISRSFQRGTAICKQLEIGHHHTNKQEEWWRSITLSSSK